MPRHQEKCTLPYTVDQMYDLVADVASYPAFLPWCVGATILESSDTHCVAELIVGNDVFREAFTSHVILVPKTTIEARYTQGPFRYLNNRWHFKPTQDGLGCHVDFEVDFELKSFLLQRVMNTFFTHAVQKMVHAFELRAKGLYSAV